MKLISKPDLQIMTYIQCGKCVEEFKSIKGKTMQKYAQQEVGWTKTGIQVVCKRHKISIINIDFEGAKVTIGQE